MSRDLLLGIDLGAGSLKATLTDAEGHLVADAAAPVTTSTPHGGWSRTVSARLVGRGLHRVAAAAGKGRRAGRAHRRAFGFRRRAHPGAGRRGRQRHPPGNPVERPARRGADPGPAREGRCPDPGGMRQSREPDLDAAADALAQAERAGELCPHQAHVSGQGLDQEPFHRRLDDRPHRCRRNPDVGRRRVALVSGNLLPHRLGHADAAADHEFDRNRRHRRRRGGKPDRPCRGNAGHRRRLGYRRGNLWRRPDRNRAGRHQAGDSGHRQRVVGGPARQRHRHQLSPRHAGSLLRDRGDQFLRLGAQVVARHVLHAAR